MSAQVILRASANWKELQRELVARVRAAEDSGNAADLAAAESAWVAEMERITDRCGGKAPLPLRKYRVSHSLTAIYDSYNTNWTPTQVRGPPSPE